MRFSTYGITAGALLIALAAGVPAAHAAERFSDAICPQATAKVIDFNELGGLPKVNLGDLRDRAHAVIDRYDDCARQKLSDGYIEPKMHYAQDRAAQFLVLAARIEATMHDYETAQSDLNRAKTLASEVAEWRPVDSRSGARPSYYKESAQEILTAITEAQTLIPKLQIQPPTGSSPAPAATLKP